MVLGRRYQSTAVQTIPVISEGHDQSQDYKVLHKFNSRHDHHLHAQCSLRLPLDPCSCNKTSFFSNDRPHEYRQETTNVLLSSSQMEHLVLMVKHHDPVGSHTDRVLGMVIVDTATALQAPGISTQEWFPVRKGPGMKAGHVPQGKVHVKVCRVSCARSGGRGGDRQLVKARTTRRVG